MTVPHRNFTTFYHISAHGHGDSSFADPEDWDNDHITACIIGRKRITGYPGGADHVERYDLFYKGVESQGWGEISGADKCMSVCTQARLLPPFLDNVPLSTFNLGRGCLYRTADNWDPALGTGRYTDGLSAEYYDYPHDYHAGDTTMTSVYTNLPVPASPTTKEIWHEAWNAYGNESLAYKQSVSILTRGMILLVAAFSPSTVDWDDGEGFLMNVAIDHIRIKYFNPCINSFSRYKGPTAGGFELVVYGLGLHNDDDEIDEGGYSRVTDVGSSWVDCVDDIYIEDVNGSVVASLEVDLAGVPGGRDFTRGSNTQITIYSFPALPAGLYCLRLGKSMALVEDDGAEGYAGEWRTTDAGLMRPGERLWIEITDESEPPGPPVPRVKLCFKKGEEELCEYYAPIDIRATKLFYEGVILSLSSLSRGVNDQSGLPVFADLDLELNNTDKKFSKILAEYWVKNQMLWLYYGFQNEADVFKDIIFQGIVTDYQKPGATWKLKIRDHLDKYFNVMIPRYRCSVDEYPDIHPNHAGREMPEVLGHASLTTGSSKGAVEAIYVDTVGYEYLGARGSLFEVEEVYADGAVVDPADYAIVYKDGGRTYIVFENDQRDAKITFNCKGYTYSEWDDPDSGGEYVRNPTYLILYVLYLLCLIPDSLIDFDSFDALAATFTAQGYEQIGYAVMQDSKSASENLAELLWTYGVKIWEASDGRITAGKKDIGDYATDVVLFQQIDLLADAERLMGFDEIVNYAPIKWGFFPTANYYVHNSVAEREASVEAHGVEIMPKSDWVFNWTLDETFVAARAEEELLRYGFGDQRLRISVSIEHIDDLDILDNFRFQDPYGISLSGGGDVGRYFYVERLTHDLGAGTMDIEAVDLQWLLRQYLVLGDEGAIAGNWADATEDNRMYAYLAGEATGMFSDGEPGKTLIDDAA